MASTRPESAWMPSARLKGYVVVSGRVMPGVRTARARRSETLSVQSAARGRSNIGIEPTRTGRACYHRRPLRAAHPGRYIASLAFGGWK